MSTRAKFRCASVKTWTAGSVTVSRWNPDGSRTDVASYPREVEFTAVMDNDTPENARFAQSTPSGKLVMTVDNPAVDLQPGTDYYLDISPVPTGDVTAQAGTAQATGAGLM